jgi:hypothetical protein
VPIVQDLPELPVQANAAHVHHAKHHIKKPFHLAHITKCIFYLPPRLEVAILLDLSRQEMTRHRIGFVYTPHHYFSPCPKYQPATTTITQANVNDGPS